MAIPTGLLGKGLFGLCLVGSGAGGFVFGKDIVDWATGVTSLLRELNIPEGCKARGEICEVSADDFKKILFKNKDGDKPLTVTGLDSGTVKLKIEKGQDSDIFTNYPHLKFTIIHDKDLEIKKTESDDSDKITVKKKTNTEFKVNNEKKLEKAWSADSLAKKAGLKECINSNNTKKCTIQTSGLKFSDDNGQTIKDLTPSGSNDVTDKITYTEDTENYNQGFKFNVSAEVTGSGTNSVNLPQGSYEVKYDTTNGWYLSKKDNTAT